MKIVLIPTFLACVTAAFAKEPSGKKAAQYTPIPPPVSAERNSSPPISPDAFRDAFNRGDAKAVAALWAPDGEYIDEEGRRFIGRETIAAEYAKFFAAYPGVKIQIAVDSLRMVGPSTAIEDGRTAIHPAPPGIPGSSKYTAVHVLVDGKWLMATVRDSRVEHVSAYDHLRDLEWMVGSWSAEEHGASVSMTLSWGPGKSFLERSYSVNKGGIATAAGKQIIAWDAQGQRIESWTFSSDGGRSLGIWSPTEGGWSIATSSLAADGSTASSVNSYLRIDDNGLAWRSTQRTSAGVAQPDLPEVVLRRVPTNK